MRVDLFDFDLPESFIAKQPLQRRDTAKMLLVPSLENKQVCDLVDILPANSLIVLNNTKVIPARIFGNCNGRNFEITLHKNTGVNTWLAFIKNSKKLHDGDKITFSDDSLCAVVKAKHGDRGTELEFNKHSFEFFETLAKIGTLPLPPYLKREATKEDFEHYQTVYAKSEGAVAAPTAGLHFTDDLMERLKSKGTDFTELTLHVGAGTFQPVKVEDTTEHKMHSEYVHISKAVADKINTAKRNKKVIVAVGTTVLRSLESAVDSDGFIHEFDGETDIFITPPYKFRSVDYLMTNFHLPKSTLFMLVCAFAGMEEMKAAYEFAKANNYRFYSYGDSSLLKRKDI